MSTHRSSQYLTPSPDAGMPPFPSRDRLWKAPSPKFARRAWLAGLLGILGVSAAALNAAQRDITAAAQKQQRTNDDIARYAKSAQERLASGNLLAPANDSAVSNAERLRLLDVRHPTTVQVVREVRTRLIAEARARVASKQVTEAAAFLDAAESLGGDADLADR